MRRVYYDPQTRIAQWDVVVTHNNRRTLPVEDYVEVEDDDPLKPGDLVEDTGNGNQ